RDSRHVPGYFLLQRFIVIVELGPRKQREWRDIPLLLSDDVITTLRHAGDGERSIQAYGLQLKGSFRMVIVLPEHRRVEVDDWLQHDVRQARWLLRVRT